MCCIPRGLYLFPAHPRGAYILLPLIQRRARPICRRPWSWCPRRVMGEMFRPPSGLFRGPAPLTVAIIGAPGDALRRGHAGRRDGARPGASRGGRSQEGDGPPAWIPRSKNRPIHPRPGREPADGADSECRFLAASSRHGSTVWRLLLGASFQASEVGPVDPRGLASAAHDQRPPTAGAFPLDAERQGPRGFRSCRRAPARRVIQPPA